MVTGLAQCCSPPPTRNGINIIHLNQRALSLLHFIQFWQPPSHLSSGAEFLLLLLSTRGPPLRGWCSQISFYIQQNSTLIKYTLYIYSCLLIYLPNTQLLLSHIYFNCNKLFHVELWTACKIIRHIKELPVWKTALLFLFVPKWKKRGTKKR